jgi:hypothetical protein
MAFSPLLADRLDWVDADRRNEQFTCGFERPRGKRCCRQKAFGRRAGGRTHFAQAAEPGSLARIDEDHRLCDLVDALVNRCAANRARN